MTNPCEIGLRCPFMRYDRDNGEPICVYPYGVIVPETETFALIECVDCSLVGYDTPLEAYLFDYTMNNRSGSE